jgi:hypothetical protein
METEVSQPDFEKLRQFHSDLNTRFEQVKGLNEEKEISPFKSKSFQTSLNEYLALINVKYITTGKFIDPFKDEPAQDKDESLEAKGFAVSGSKNKANKLDPALQGMPAARLALESGADLFGEDD